MVRVKMPELRRVREEMKRRSDDLRKTREELAKRGHELRRLEQELRKGVIREEVLSFRKEFQKNLIAFLTGAFAFVAAFTWNDLIRETITFLVPPSKELFYKYLTAIAVTFIVIFVLYILSKFKSKD